MRIPSQTGLGDFVLREDSSGSLDRWEFVPYPTGRFTLPNDIYMSALIHRTLPQSDGPTPDQIAARKASGYFDGNGNYIPPKAATAPMLRQEDVNSGTFTETQWNSERAIGALNLWRWYEAKIASGELMTKAMHDSIMECRDLDREAEDTTEG